LRTHSPELAVTTDVIVGFPGETDVDFADTQAVAADAGLTGMHVFRYSPRAGTAAPRLGLPVDDPVSRDRSHRLQAQADDQRQAYEARFIGRELEVIWDRHLPSRMRGLTDNYITVYAPERGQVLGSLARVRPLTRIADGLLCA
jgi:threonylcarbamoyladenosine tRNA methylthiotransferase MtaB